MEKDSFFLFAEGIFMITTHRIKMDLTRQHSAERLEMVQCDTNSRCVELVLTAAGAAWAPEGLENVFLRYRKCDGSGGSYDTLPDGVRAWTVEGNVLTILIAPQVLTVPGLVELQALLISASENLATFSFRIAVEADPSLGTVTSEDYINWTAWSRKELDKQLAQAKDSGDFDGATYFPGVDARGMLFWTNDKGVKNPDPVDMLKLLTQRLAGEMLVKRSGDKMSGMLDMDGNRITGLGEPEAASDAVPKSYVDTMLHRASVTLQPIWWSGGQMAAQVSGVTADNLVLVTPAPQSIGDCVAHGVRCSSQEKGRLIFSCDSVPDKSIVMNVAVFVKGDQA